MDDALIAKMDGPRTQPRTLASVLKQSIKKTSTSVSHAKKSSSIVLNATRKKVYALTATRDLQT